MLLRRGTIRTFVLFFIIALVILGPSFFIYRSIMTPSVVITDVVQGPVVQAFYATGTLLPDREYSMRSNVEGNVTKVFVDKGDPVEEGQALAFVRVEEFILKYAQASADLTLKRQWLDDSSSPVLSEFNSRIKAANEQLIIAQRELGRVTELRSVNSTTPQDVDRANDKVQIAWSALEALKSQRASKVLELQRDVTVAQAALDIAQWNVDQQTIRSPIKGSVLDRPISVGTRVKVSDPLLVVADVAPEKLIMRSSVDEEDKTRVRIDQDVHMTLYAYPGKVFTGRVSRIYPKADTERRTFEVDVAIAPVDAGFSAGMTGELAFVVNSREQAVVVPSQSVNGDVLWIFNHGHVQKQTVKTGLRSVERVEILDGAKVSQQVVISPTDKLSSGQSVRTTFMEPAKAAGLNTPIQEKAVNSFR